MTRNKILTVLTFALVCACMGNCVQASSKASQAVPSASTPSYVALGILRGLDIDKDGTSAKVIVAVSKWDSDRQPKGNIPTVFASVSKDTRNAKNTIAALKKIKKEGTGRFRITKDPKSGYWVLIGAAPTVVPEKSPTETALPFNAKSLKIEIFPSSKRVIVSSALDIEITMENIVEVPVTYNLHTDLEIELVAERLAEDKKYYRVWTWSKNTTVREKKSTVTILPGSKRVWNVLWDLKSDYGSYALPGQYRLRAWLNITGKEKPESDPVRIELYIPEGPEDVRDSNPDKNPQ